MSVINQMLLDLERRRASGDERDRIPDHVRALPGESAGTSHQRVGVIIGGAVALAVLLAVAGWLWFSPAAFLSPAPAPSPAPSPAPVANAPAPAVATAPPAAAPEAPLQTASALDAGSKPEVSPPAESKPQTTAPALPEAERIAMRMSFELSKIPDQGAAQRQSSGVSLKSVVARAPAAPEKSAADTAPRTRSAAEPQRAAKPVSEKAAPVADSKQASSASASTAAPVSSNVGINKQVREGTPRQRADAEYARGVAALHQGHGSEARAAFEAALQADPAHHVARQALTGTLLEIREFGVAMNLLQEGLELAPAQSGFAMMLARLQVERGQLDAGLLQRQQKHAEAVTQFQRALQLRPNAGVWLLRLGLSLDALGRSADAQEAFRRARSSGNLPPDLQTYAEQRAR